VARLVAITIIIVAHTNIRSPYESGCAELAWITQIAGWHPIIFFFFFAGYFTNTSKTQFKLQRCFQLFVSLCIWAVIGYFCFGCIYQLSQNGRCDVWALFTPKIFGAIGDFFHVSTPGNYDLWFLKVLVAFSFFSPLFEKISTPRMLAICAMFLLLNPVVKILPANVQEWLPFFIKGEVLIQWAFFVAGMAMRRTCSPSQLGRYVEKIWIYVLIACVISRLLAFMGVSQIWETAWYFSRLMGIVYVLSIAKAIQKIFPRFAGWISQFGVSVFFIYVMQEILVQACWAYFTFHPINKHFYTLVPFIIVAVCILLFSLVNRYLPCLAPYICLYNKKRGS